MVSSGDSDSAGFCCWHVAHLLVPLRSIWQVATCETGFIQSLHCPPWLCVHVPITSALVWQMTLTDINQQKSSYLFGCLESLAWWIVPSGHWCVVQRSLHSCPFSSVHYVWMRNTVKTPHTSYFHFNLWNSLLKLSQSNLWILSNCAWEDLDSRKIQTSQS